jgi:hypothetical protein
MGQMLKEGYFHIRMRSTQFSEIWTMTRKYISKFTLIWFGSLSILKGCTRKKEDWVGFRISFKEEVA